jgi:hypothetical protein
MPDEKPSDPPAPEAKTTWGQWFKEIPDGIKIPGTAVLTILGALLVSYWTTKEAHLTVASQEPFRFEGDKNKSGFFNFSVKSDGDKEAEGIECTFKTEGATVVEVKMSPDNLHATKEVADGTVTVKVPSLNRGRHSKSRPCSSIRGPGTASRTFR